MECTLDARLASSTINMAEESSNALGLDFSEAVQESQPVENEQASPVSGKAKPPPYVNPDRVKTGGNQRVCQLDLFNRVSAKMKYRKLFPKRPLKKE